LANILSPKIKTNSKAILKYGMIQGARLQNLQPKQLQKKQNYSFAHQNVKSSRITLYEWFHTFFPQGVFNNQGFTTRLSTAQLNVL
jgi:hypothetical protein